MKIAMFTENFYPELSGISDSIATISKSLGKRGHEIHIFAPHYAHRNFAHLGLVYRELTLGENVHIHRLSSMPFPGPTDQARLVVPSGLTTLTVKKIKPDVIHTHLFFGVGFEGLIAAKLLKIPFMGTNHTPISEFVKYSPLHGRRLMNWSKRAVSWYYNKCAFVTAPSQSVLDEMKEYNFKRPSQVVSNPIMLDDFKPVSAEKKAELKKKFGLGPQSILYTGRLAEEKHLDVVMRAFALAKGQNHDLTLAITGRGQSENALKILTSTLSLGDSVKFTGFLNPEEFKELYQASDIFAIASTAETQSIALMQALSVGLPPIVVDARALPEYVNDTNGFVVPVGDFKAMSEKMLTLLSDSVLYSQLSAGAIQSVNQFSIEQITDEWESLYFKIANEKLRK